MSPKENARSKGLRWFLIIPGVFTILGLGGYLLFTQFILKPIAAEEERAYQLSRENRKLSKEYEERQSILMQVVKAKRSRLLAMNTLEAVASNIPEEVTLDSITFSENRNQDNNVSLRGRVSRENLSKLNDYTGSLAKAKNAQAANQPLFSQVMPPNMDARTGGYLSWYIIGIIKMEEPNTVDASNPILPEAPQPVNYKWEMEEQSPLKIFLDGKKRLKSVAAKLQKEKKAYTQIFTSIQTIEAGGKSIPNGFLPFARDVRQAQKLLQGIESKARRAGLIFTRSRGLQSARRKDQIFDEHRRHVSFQCNPKDLTNFIRSINQETAAIRVTNMQISPTANRKQLKVDLTLSTHYLKAAESNQWLPNAAIENQGEAIHQYLENASQLFSKSDIFRLIKSAAPEEPKIVAPPRVTVKVPLLKGVLRINGKESALLRISPSSGGKAEYVQIGVGERLHGVEVARIDLKQEIVEVIIRGHTFSLELAKMKASSPSPAPSSRSSSSSGSRPTTGNSGLPRVPSRGISSSRGSLPSGSSGPGSSRGSSSRGTLKAVPNRGGSRTNSPTPPTGEGLKTVPTRPRS